MIGADKPFIQCLQALYLQVGGDNESVDHIVLEFFFVSAFIRLVQRAAGRYIAVHQESEIAAEFIYINLPCLPFTFLSGILCDIRVGEHLIEVSSGDHIIPLPGLTLQQFPQLFCLCDLAFSAVISFQMEIDQDQFFGVWCRYPGDQYTSLQVRDTDRP